jgi:hypothetical protein
LETQVNEVEQYREVLGFGRTLEPLEVLINMYKNRYDGTVLILVSMFGGCSPES